MRKPALTPDEWRRQLAPNCYHLRRRITVIYEDDEIRTTLSECLACETELATKEEWIKDAGKDESTTHNPGHFYTLRDLAEFDRYSSATPDQRRAWDDKERKR